MDVTQPPHWQPSTKRMVAGGLVVAGLIVLYLARDVLPLVALAGLLAFLVAPAVRFATRVGRMPKAVALILSYLLVFLGTVLVGVIVANGIINSVSEVDPPKAVESLRGTALNTLNTVETVDVFGYTFDLGEVVSPLREQLADSDSDSDAGSDSEADADSDADSDSDQESSAAGPESANTTPSDASDEDATEAAPANTSDDEANRITVGRQQASLLIGGALDSLRTVGGIVSALLVSSLLTLMMAVYLNIDSHKFAAGVRSYIPTSYLPEVTELGSNINGIWKGYLYGQLINSLATGMLVWLALWALGLPGAFVLGVIMALLNMIPTFGPILAAVPGVLSAFALGSTRFDISNLTFTLVIVVVYVVVVQLQANVMAPFITGRAVRMMPVSILVGLIVGVQVAGLIGALLVVPIMATGKEIVKYAMAKLLDRPPYPELLAVSSDVPDDAADEADATDAQPHPPSEEVVQTEAKTNNSP